MSSHKTHSLPVPRLFEHRDKQHNLIKQYQRKNCLGRGGFATVYKCQSLTSKLFYACKLVDKRTLKKSYKRKKLVSEIKLHRSLNHKNIVQFQRFFEDKHWIYILLEICINGTLKDIIHNRKTITEAETRLWFKQIVIAVQYLHNQQIIHRDLKLANILLDNNMNIKLCDFGLAAKLESEDERRTTICGTPNYTAPEILHGKNGGHSYEVDIWSLGVILYTLLCGCPPFETKHSQTTYHRIRHLKYCFPPGMKLSMIGKNLIKSLLVTDPLQRLTLNEMLKHPFLNGMEDECPIPERIPESAKFTQPTKEQLFPIFNQNKSRNEIKSEENGNENKNITKLMSLMFIRKQRTSSILYIINWIDYRYRYGMGYIFNNGNTGIHFNDHTTILYLKNNTLISYICENKTKIFKINDDGNYYHIENEDGFLKNIKKKIHLLMRFQKYLFSKLNSVQKNIISDYNSMHMSNDESESEISDVFVDNIVCTPFATVFQLKNNTVQIDFNDGSQIIQCSEYILYTNKSQVKEVLLVKDLEGNMQRDLRKRMRYLQNILNGM